MDLGLENRVALVTGAGRGIGQAEAAVLAAEGAHIAVNDIDPDSAERCAEQMRTLGVSALAVAGDVTDPDSVADIVARTTDHLGRLDILVNNAGLGGACQYLLKSKFVKHQIVIKVFVDMKLEH